ncbi:MAG: hypothetical protein H6908_01850 [Hyphomicrobiales bacterium]|nr:hypothetical protein [Rickettsiales bacterium]MCP5361377.1 hypothetical protein [Hyphomicrobiales bacterium]
MQDALNDIQRARRLVTLLLEQLEQEITEQMHGRETLPSRICSNRESPVAVLVRLSQLLLKLIPFEEKLQQAVTETASNTQTTPIPNTLTENEITILKRYLHRYEHAPAPHDPEPVRPPDTG